jgi:hypothetical protein
MATLRDLELASFVTATSGRRLTGASDHWIVLLDDGKPVSAIPPGTTLPDGTRPPGIIVAAAGLGLGDALSSAAFAEVADVSAVVLTDGDEIVGVLAGPALVGAVLQGAPRGDSGPVLPGPPTIPWISRSCGFTEHQTICATVSSFASRPYPMPSCRNERRLTAHLFHW